VAARDEEPTIERCVRSLLAQDYPNFEVLVVDDRSSDRTPQILEALLREAPERLRVLTIDQLPHGWFGKSHAMHRAVAASSGDWLLFTDADCRQSSPDSVSTAVRYAEDQDADFLTLTPALEVHTWWEKILQPVCAIVLLIWFLPHRVNNAKNATAYANGAFMLLRRSCYDAIGGHESVRTRMNEDIHLARLAKRTGFRLQLAVSESIYETRMYGSLRQAWHGWSRIFFGCLESVPRLAVAAGLVALFSILPWVSFLAALAGWAWANGRHPWSWAAGVWFAGALFMQLTLWRLYPTLSGRRHWSLFYVLGAAMTFGILLNAILKALGATKTNWRGTHYRREGFAGDAVILPSEP
jgi:cellulose synthase/poly-beta-1,6-N-acetylglucosamine synthase-like glycosyltransferase